MSTPTAIKEFWHLFEKLSGALASISTADDPVYDELLAQLQLIDGGLYCEFSTHPGEREFIITAEGDVLLFDLVTEIVAAAPKATGWKFFALKPKLGFPESAQWEGYRINIGDLLFEPLSGGEFDDFGIRLLVPELKEADADSAHAALVRAIDHGLGERQFAESIQYLEVAPLSEEFQNSLPLEELESFIQWRKKQRKQ